VHESVQGNCCNCTWPRGPIRDSVVEPIFSTNLTSPEWQTSAERLSLASGSFVAVVLSILLRDAQKSQLKVWAWIGFFLTLACLGACWTIWFYLGPPGPGQRGPSEPGWWRDIWEGVFVLGMILLVSTISVAALSLEERSKWFWILVIVPLLALIAIAIYVFWLR
jgi:hypothetical protein